MPAWKLCFKKIRLVFRELLSFNIIQRHVGCYRNNFYKNFKIYSSLQAPTKLRWMPPEYFKRDQKMIYNEQTMIWPLGVTLWEIFSLGGTPFGSLRQAQTFIDAMRDGSAQLDPISYCGEAVTQLLATCTSHVPEARGDIRTIIKRLECISADAKVGTRGHCFLRGRLKRKLGHGE